MLLRLNLTGATDGFSMEISIESEPGGGTGMCFVLFSVIVGDFSGETCRGAGSIPGAAGTDDIAIGTSGPAVTTGGGTGTGSGFTCSATDS
jgi:hypothetical protein